MVDAKGGEEKGFQREGIPELRISWEKEGKVGILEGRPGKEKQPVGGKS